MFSHGVQNFTELDILLGRLPLGTSSITFLLDLRE